MPSLPRIRRSTRPRAGADDVARTAQVAELTAAGLTWVNAFAADLSTAQTLAERFGWHPLDVEDIVSKRQRPKVDDYEEDGYLFAVLHFPVYDKTVQRLNAAELDVFIGHDYLVTLPTRELLPVTRLPLRHASQNRPTPELGRYGRAGECLSRPPRARRRLRRC